MSPFLLAAEFLLFGAGVTFGSLAILYLSLGILQDWGSSDDQSCSS